MLAAAATSLDATFLMQFLLAAVFIGQIIGLVLGILRGKQAQRRSVTFEGNPVDKAEFERHVETNRADHDHLFAKLGGEARGIRAEVKADTVRIAEQINAVDRKVSGLSSSNEEQNRQLAEMRTTLRDMPGEIIALLKNTGAIK